MAAFSFADYAITPEEMDKLNDMGLESPADCAFAFTSFDEASAHGVGGAWLATRRSARAMTSVAAAAWGSQDGFQMQSKRGVVASQDGVITPAGRSCDQGLSAFSSEGVAGLCEGLPEGPSPSDPGGGDAAVTLVEQSPSTLVATMRLPTLTIGQRDDSDDAAEYG